MTDVKEAGEVRLTPDAVLIDGEPFPYWVGEDISAEVLVDQDRWPATFLCSTGWRSRHV